jgi:hypothetical protein
VGVDLSAYFDQFLENISLGDPQVPRMDSAANTISQFLQRSNGLPPQNFFLQGSYPNGTAVEPVEGGEYDLDIVAVCVAGQTTCNDTLSDLEKRFRADGRFRDRVKRKKPCVRLEYAEDDVGKFHVDIVPVRPSADADCPFDAPRSTSKTMPGATNRRKATRLDAETMLSRSTLRSRSGHPWSLAAIPSQAQRRTAPPQS